MKSGWSDGLAAKPINFPLFTRQTQSLVPKLVSYIYIYLEQPCSQGLQSYCPLKRAGFFLACYTGDGKVRDLGTRLVPWANNKSPFIAFDNVPKRVVWKVICSLIQLKGHCWWQMFVEYRAKTWPASCTISGHYID